jgi:hypothetical protein
MGRGVLFGTLLLAAGLFFGNGAKASAQEFNHVITVYATVAEQRAIYVDDSGNIFKIAGNTSKNITPQVYGADNRPIAMTDSITRQYQDFLKSHHNYLDASVTYDLTRMVVQTAMDNRSIQLDTSGLTLGSG